MKDPRRKAGDTRSWCVETAAYYLRQLWLWKCGMAEEPVARMGALPPLESLRATEWSADFEEKMRARMVMGSIRYGLLGAPGNPTYNRVGSIEKRLGLYQETGNKEHLVDIANLCLVEYVEGGGYFIAQGDGAHVEIIKDK